MPDDNIYQPLIDQIAELLKKAEENASKPLPQKLDPATEKRILDLEDRVKLFKMLCEKQLADQGLTPNAAIQRYIRTPERFSPSEQRILRNFMELGLQVVVMGAALRRATKSKGKHRFSDTSKNPKEVIKKRKRKFKGMEGDSKWKRL